MGMSVQTDRWTGGLIPTEDPFGGCPKVIHLVTNRVCIGPPDSRVRALPPSTCMTLLGDLVSPEWVLSAEEQEGVPSGGLRPHPGGVIPCNAESCSPFPSPTGSFALLTGFLPSSTFPSWAAG